MFVVNLEHTFTSWFELLQNPAAKNILIGQDGHYEVRITPVGLFSAKIKNGYFPNGEEEAGEGFQLYVPKIPKKYYWLMLSMFVQMAKREEPVEMMVRIYWDVANQRHFLYVPYQVVGPISVRCLDNPEDIEVALNHVLVAEIHSHNVMMGWFSSVDNRDEVATGIYGVLGRVTTKQEARFRFSCGGHYREIDFNDLFVDSDEKLVHYPSNWRDRIQVLR